MTTPTMVAGYLALFFVAGFVFLFVSLLVGRLLRPQNPNPEKLEPYECGEPAIGSAYVQFDLRFYVVALLFIIFEVEVALFFPWAVVFGKMTNLAQANTQVVSDSGQLTPAAKGIYDELLVPPQATAGYVAAKSRDDAEQAIKSDARTLAMISLADIGVFFAVLLVGFAYVWRRGDLDWVRALSRERALQGGPTAPRPTESEAVLSA
jgi:NADH-quinone oxidoreductase subunit A